MNTRIWMCLSFILSLMFHQSPSLAGQIFPTFEEPTESYRTVPRKFGSPRARSRLHAACDLYQSHKDQHIRSVEDGIVLRQHYAFYQGTYAVEMKHENFVARYGEVTGRRPPSVRNGSKIKSGDLLGYVGKVNSNCCPPMLHFERYKGTLSGALSQAQNRPYQRRRDLEDPTVALEQWQKATFGPGLPLPIFIESPQPLTKSLPRRAITETGSYAALLQGFTNFARTNSSPRELFLFLNFHGFAPTRVHDTNAFTGRMTIVRSQNDRLAAYNFHTQYFRNEFGVDFVQHMSFEVRPEIVTFTEVVEAIQTKIPLLGQAQRFGADFIQWEMENGYVLWVKQLSEEDLQDNPFYSYSAQDIGSIRIAIELDPHG